MEVVNVIIVFSLCIERVKLNDRVYSIKKYSSNETVHVSSIYIFQDTRN